MTSADAANLEGDPFPDYEPAAPPPDWDAFQERVRRARDTYLSGARLFIRCTERTNPWLMYKPEYRRSIPAKRPKPPSRGPSIAETEAHFEGDSGREELGKRVLLQSHLQNQDRDRAVQPPPFSTSNEAVFTKSAPSSNIASAEQSKGSLPSPAKSPPQSPKPASSIIPPTRDSHSTAAKPISSPRQSQNTIIELDKEHNPPPAPTTLPTASPRRRLPFSQQPSPSTSASSPHKHSQSKSNRKPPKLTQKEPSFIEVDEDGNATPAGPEPIVINLDDEHEPVENNGATSVTSIEEIKDDVDMENLADMPTQADEEVLGYEDQADYTQIPEYDTQMLLNQPESPNLVSDEESAGREGSASRSSVREGSAGRSAEAKDGLHSRSEGIQLSPISLASQSVPRMSFPSQSISSQHRPTLNLFARSMEEEEGDEMDNAATLAASVSLRGSSALSGSSTIPTGGVKRKEESGKGMVVKRRRVLEEEEKEEEGQPEEFGVKTQGGQPARVSPRQGMEPTVAASFLKGKESVKPAETAADLRASNQPAQPSRTRKVKKKRDIYEFPDDDDSDTDLSQGVDSVPETPREKTGSFEQTRTSPQSRRTYRTPQRSLVNSEPSSSTRPPLASSPSNPVPTSAQTSPAPSSSLTTPPRATASRVSPRKTPTPRTRQLARHDSLSDILGSPSSRRSRSSMSPSKPIPSSPMFRAYHHSQVSSQEGDDIDIADLEALLEGDVNYEKSMMEEVADSGGEEEDEGDEEDESWEEDEGGGSGDDFW